MKSQSIGPPVKKIAAGPVLSYDIAMAMSCSYFSYESPVGVLFVASDGYGVTDLAIGVEESDFIRGVASRRAPAPALDSGRSPSLIKALDEYFLGNPVSFDVPLNPSGSAFDRLVWNALSALGDTHVKQDQIPYFLLCESWLDIKIMCTGVVPLCCVDAEGDYAIGDVTKNSVLEIYNSPRFRDLREHHLQRESLNPCGGCSPYAAVQQDPNHQSFRTLNIPVEIVGTPWE